MKSTERFKETILKYLKEKASTDKLFKTKFENEKKNIDDCITYILNTVQRSGANGFEDDEIYSMAIHYYDEENIEVGKIFDAKVIVNHTVKLTEEEIAKAKEEAKERIFNEERKRLTVKKNPGTKTTTSVKKEENKFVPIQESLFK